MSRSRAPPRAFTTEGGGKKRWGEIVALRNAAGDEALKHLAADRATRMLIAEHVRREHHRRAGELVRVRSLSLAQLDWSYFPGAPLPSSHAHS